MDDLSGFYCQNPECSDYGIRKTWAGELECLHAVRPGEGTRKSTPGRNRTCSLQIRNLLLYPLSYGRMFVSPNCLRFVSVVYGTLAICAVLGQFLQIPDRGNP